MSYIKINGDGRSLTSKNSPIRKGGKIMLPNERNFKKLVHPKYKKEKKMNLSMGHIYNDPKDELATSCQTSAKFFFGYEPNPEKTATLKKYYRSGSASFIQSISSKKIDDYYNGKIDNTQSDLNISCYKKILDISKQEYGNCLKQQIEEKKREKEEKKLKEIRDFQEIVKNNHNIYIQQNKEKLEYLISLQKNFIEENNKLQVERKVKKETEKLTERKNDAYLEKKYQEKEMKCQNELKYEQFRKKEYLRKAILNQIKLNSQINKQVNYK